MLLGTGQAVGTSGCAGDASGCVWHLEEHGMAANFAGQKLSPSSQQGEQSPQLPAVGSGAGALQPPGAAHCSPLLSLRLSQQQVNEHNLKGFRRKPSTQTGTGLGVQREN